MFTISENVSRMKPSSTIAAMQAAQKLKAAGNDVIDLSVGEPDFDTPDFIKQAAWEALQGGATKYTATAGIKGLQDAIVNFYERDFGAKFATSNVMATSGGKQAIFNAIVTICQRGDEVLIPKPYWVSFPEIVAFSGAESKYIETEETNFVLTAEQVKAAITPKTKAIILNSPSNPSGRVIQPDEFRKIIEVCVENGVYVVSDECYLQFVYPPNEVFTVASLPKELLENICIAGSFSKTLAMTGWRVGYTIAPAAWTKAMLKVQSHSTSHPTSFAQYACAFALNEIAQTQNALSEMLAEYTRRRAWFIPELNKLGLKCEMPEGAFYAYPNLRGLLNDKIKTSAEFCDKLLNDEFVVVTDGECFGTDGFARISYATSMENLQKAIARIANFIENNR